MAIAMVAFLAIVPAVTGYDGQLAAQISVQGPASLNGPGSATVIATVLDGNGKPIVDQTVVWSTASTSAFGGTRGFVVAGLATTAAGTSTTDQDGRASTVVSVPVGGITVTAQADDAFASAVILCCGGAQALPRTDIRDSGGTWIIVVLALALIALGGLYLRRTVRA